MKDSNRSGTLLPEMVRPQSKTESPRKDSGVAIAHRHSLGTILLLLLGVYFGFHVLTRSVVSHNLQLDEAEQFILTQDWRWGYGAQPPLYNWLQKALFSALGVNVFALSLLKNLSLWAAYAFTFLAAREILVNARLAALATAALLFFPQIAWESQRDQSHLVLATTAAAATLWIFVRLLKTGAAIWYISLGVAMAVGFLSKYNYLLLPVPLICAALMMRQYRQSVLSSKIALTFLVFAAITAPHMIWMIGNKTEVTSQNSRFLTTGLLAPNSPIAGVLQVFKAYIGMAVVPLLIFAPFMIRKFKSKSLSRETTPLLDWLAKAFVIGFALTVIVVIASHATYLRDRWVQPLMLAFPILLIGLLHEHIHERNVKQLFALAAVVALTALTAINVTVIGANTIRRSHNLNIPYPELAAQFRKRGFEHGTIIANGFLVGGNLKNQYRDCRVMVPEMADKLPPQRPVLIVWSARFEDLPPEFRAYASRLTGLPPDQTPSYLDIPCKNGRRTSEKFGFFLLR